MTDFDEIKSDSSRRTIPTRGSFDESSYPVLNLTGLVSHMERTGWGGAASMAVSQQQAASNG